MALGGPQSQLVGLIASWDVLRAIWEGLEASWEGLGASWEGLGASKDVGGRKREKKRITEHFQYVVTP